MLLLSHILIAFAGLGLGAYTYFKPSNGYLLVAYAFGAGTLLSGVFLLINRPSHIMSACIAGLIYFTLLGTMVVAAKHRLTALNAHL